MQVAGMMVRSSEPEATVLGLGRVECCVWVEGKV